MVAHDCRIESFIEATYECSHHDSTYSLLSYGSRDHAVEE